MQWEKRHSKVISDVEKVMGRGIKKPTKDEEIMNKFARRSIVISGYT